MRLRATPSAALGRIAHALDGQGGYVWALPQPCHAAQCANCAPTVADSDQGRPLAYNTPCDRARASLG